MTRFESSLFNASNVVAFLVFKLVPMKTIPFIRFGLVFALIFWMSPAFALNLNLPYGTLNSDFSVTTRVGTFPNLIRYGPRPASGTIPAHFHGSGIIIIDFNTVRGNAHAARVFRSTGSRQVDNVLIDTLQQWRVQPRTVYKIHVPVTITGHGRVLLGNR